MKELAILKELAIQRGARALQVMGRVSAKAGGLELVLWNTTGEVGRAKNEGSCRPWWC